MKDIKKINTSFIKASVSYNLKQNEKYTASKKRIKALEIAFEKKRNEKF